MALLLEWGLNSSKYGNAHASGVGRAGGEGAHSAKASYPSS